MTLCRPRAIALRLVAACLISCPRPLWANPTAGEVAAGSAEISSSGGTLTVIQASNNAIINWRDFSINQGELTQFIQPSALSAVLNRVTGGDPSTIYGTLQANGRVFLINPNGITVGPTGVINTQSFVASTLDLNNDDFMAGGALRFSGSSAASLINAGRISALGGDVILIAHTVLNTGDIAAPEGTAALAAGSEVLIQPSGDERVFVKAGGDEKAAVGVDQQGQIAAATAELKAAGGNVYSLAINNSGIIQATGVRRCGGRVYLIAEGENIALKSGSVIDASGATGGGTVLIGGDSRGQNPDVPNAAVVTVEQGATIRADALENGDGGKVVVWGTKAAFFRGAISAKGGAQGGNGGSAEVSGGYIDFQGLADLTAPSGLLGSLLLDPYNMTISHLPQSGVLPCGCDNDLLDLGNAEGSNLQDTFLVEQLTTANVTVQTDANGSPLGGDITIAGGAHAANLTWSNPIGANAGASGKLTLLASRDIFVEAGSVINATNHGGVEFNANNGNGTISLNANVTTNGGAQTYNGRVVLQQADEVLTTGGGAVSFLDTVDGTSSGSQSLSIEGAGDVTFAGSVGGTTRLGALDISGTGTTNLRGGAVRTDGAQTYNELVNLGADAALDAGAAAVTFNGDVHGAHDLTVDAGAIIFNGGGVDTDGDIRLNGPVSAGDVSLIGRDVAWNAALSARNLRLFGRNILMGGDVSSFGRDGVLMVAENSFKNAAAHSITPAGRGRFLIYSVDPARNFLGGLTGSTQYSTTYKKGSLPGFAGNGFLYSASGQVPDPGNSGFGTMLNSADPFDGVLFIGGGKEPEDGRTYVDAGDDNGSATSSDLFSWDLGTMRDAVASTEGPQRKKKKRK